MVNGTLRKMVTIISSGNLQPFHGLSVGTTQQAKSFSDISTIKQIFVASGLAQKDTFEQAGYSD